MPRKGPVPRLHRRGRAAAAQVPCPHCQYAYSRQIATRATPDGYLRKRLCLRAPEGSVTAGGNTCGRQFTTYEVHASAIVLLRRIREWREDQK